MSNPEKKRSSIISAIEKVRPLASPASSFLYYEVERACEDAYESGRLETEDDISLLRLRLRQLELMMEDWNYHLKKENKLAEKIGTTFDDYVKRWKPNEEK